MSKQPPAVLVLEDIEDAADAGENAARDQRVVAFDAAYRLGRDVAEPRELLAAQP